jgi:hypothetical protein
MEGNPLSLCWPFFHFGGAFTVRVLLSITRSPNNDGVSPELLQVSPQLGLVSPQLFEVSPREVLSSPQACFPAYNSP